MAAGTWQNPAGGRCCAFPGSFLPHRQADASPQSEAAARLGMSVEAVKVAGHRLRKRFRDAVKEEIAQTVGQAGDMHEELDALMRALRK